MPIEVESACSKHPANLELVGSTIEFAMVEKPCAQLVGDHVVEPVQRLANAERGPERDRIAPKQREANRVSRPALCTKLRANPIVWTKRANAAIASSISCLSGS